MKNLIAGLTLLTLSTSSSLSFAGEGSSCHFHGKRLAQESTVEQCANQRRDIYLRNGTLDASWSEVTPASIEVVDGKKGKEWKVRFDNPNAKDSAKSKLYMFFSAPGNFIAANYTGK